MEKTEIWKADGREDGKIVHKNTGKFQAWTDHFIKTFSGLEEAKAWMKKHGYTPALRSRYA